MSERAYDLYEHAMNAASNGNLEEAIRLALESSEIQCHPHTAMRLSEWYSTIGNPLEALKWAGLGHALKPNHTQVATRFAEECVRQGLIERGIEVLERAIELNQDYGPAKRLLAKAHELRDDSGEVPS